VNCLSPYQQVRPSGSTRTAFIGTSDGRILTGVIGALQSLTEHHLLAWRLIRSDHLLFLWYNNRSCCTDVVFAQERPN
jgi:hypothetical protein